MKLFLLSKGTLTKVTLVNALFLLMLTSAQAKVVDTIEKSFQVNDKASLRLDNINGSVDITAWDQNEIKVTAVITADDQEDRDRITIDFKHNDRGVMVETEYEQTSSWGNNHHSGEVEYTVMVPANTELSSLELVNGSLTISGVQGEIKADLVNGSIKAEGLIANSEFNSVNGSIKVSYLATDKNVNDIKLETVNGSIKLYLPKDVGAFVEVSTMNGSIKNDFGLIADKNMFVGRHLEGKIGHAEINIDIESVNGSVKIMKNQP